MQQVHVAIQVSPSERGEILALNPKLQLARLFFKQAEQSSNRMIVHRFHLCLKIVLLMVIK
jgi:hypothetical protein